MSSWGIQLADKRSAVIICSTSPQCLNSATKCTTTSRVEKFLVPSSLRVVKLKNVLGKGSAMPLSQSIQKTVVGGCSEHLLAISISPCKRAAPYKERSGCGVGSVRKERHFTGACMPTWQDIHEIFHRSSRSGPGLAYVKSCGWLCRSVPTTYLPFHLLVHVSDVYHSLWC